jgi:hypothetical protein
MKEAFNLNSTFVMPEYRNSGDKEKLLSLIFRIPVMDGVK